MYVCATDVSVAWCICHWFVSLPVCHSDTRQNVALQNRLTPCSGLRLVGFKEHFVRWGF